MFAFYEDSGSLDSFLIYQVVWRGGVYDDGGWVYVHIFYHSEDLVRDSTGRGILNTRRVVFVDQILANSHLINEPSSQCLPQRFQLDGCGKRDLPDAIARRTHLSFIRRSELRCKESVGAREIDANDVADLRSEFMNFLHSLGNIC